VQLLKIELSLLLHTQRLPILFNGWLHNPKITPSHMRISTDI